MKQKRRLQRVEKKRKNKYRSVLYFLKTHYYLLKERLKAAEAKRIEKERTEKYTKMKSQAKEERAKFREKVELIINYKKFV